MAMKMTGAKAIVKSLEIEKVNVIFGYPGAAISPFYDALCDSPIRHILTRHEQGAGHAANGYARVTGKTGVCVVTSGPGSTNVITGVATAYMDSISMVVITGQVLTSQIGKDVFQEVDITGATAPFTKHSYLVKKASDLSRIVKEAFYIASTGRPGPVLIDVPLDVQMEEFDFEYPKSLDIKGYKPTYKGHPSQITKIAEAVANAKCPIICAGGGIISGGASEELISFSEKCNIPVVTTLMGIGAIPSDYHLNVGMMGSHGSPKANWAMNNADLIMIMGARVGDRAMSSMYKLEEKAVIVHIDIDPAEIGKNIETDIPVTGDVRYVLEQLIKECKKGDFEGWHKQLDFFDTVNISENNKENELGNKRENTEKAKNTTEYVSPKYFLECLSELNTVRNKGDIIVTTEVGQNQIWAANHYKIKKPRTFISSGGMGTMGFGLPSAVGARVGCPDCRVVSISGDGSFQMSMQELGTMKQNIIGVKIVIFNNSSLGMVKELQEKKYCRCSQVYLDENPDFIAIAAAYGFKGSRITKNDEVKEALGRLFEDNETYLLECIVDPDEPTL
jgi:acetolactate synthase I/II/III large subunit